MSTQPPIPELPPMQPASAAPAPDRAALASLSSSVAPKSGFGGTRRLRQAVTVLASGGLLFTGAIVGLELIARPGLRPTDVMATMEARTDLGTFNQKMGAAPGEVLMTEDQYRAEIAEAERSGQAKAEIVYQQDLAAVQADKERVVGAYQILYQRTNIIAQAGVQMESVAMQFRQRLIEQTNGGRVVVISIYDMLCATGQQDMCEAAKQARAGMIDEADGLTEHDLARKVMELMADIPDPASLLVAEDQRTNGTPSIRR